MIKDIKNVLDRSLVLPRIKSMQTCGYICEQIILWDSSSSSEDQDFCSLTLLTSVELAYLCVCSDGQLCLTLSHPIDCSLTGFSIYAALQARMLEWGVISSSRDLPSSGIEPTSFTSPALASRCFTTSATWEAQHGFIDKLLILLENSHTKCKRNRVSAMSGYLF